MEFMLQEKSKALLIKSETQCHEKFLNIFFCHTKLRTPKFTKCYLVANMENPIVSSVIFSAICFTHINSNSAKTQLNKESMNNETFQGDYSQFILRKTLRVSVKEKNSERNKDSAVNSK